MFKTTAPRRPASVPLRDPGDGPAVITLRICADLTQWASATVEHRWDADQLLAFIGPPAF
jgi:hypothetical protein